MKKYIVTCVSLCLCLCLCFTLIACDSNRTTGLDVTPTPTPSLDPAPSGDTSSTVTDPVLQIGECILDGVDLNYYYYTIANDSYWSQYGLDMSLPLTEQFTPDETQEQTWDSFFLEYGMQTLEYIIPMYLEAKSLNMSLSQDNQSRIDEELVWMESQCAEGQTLDEYLVTIFEEGMTRDRLVEIMEREMLGTQLEAEKTGQEFSEEELRAYYEANVPEADWDTSYTVNVRHILLETTEEAQEVYDEWLAGDKTEESFAALATQYTTDPGSQQTGGLYEEVYQGDMVESFDVWCFDEARKPGDTDLVETEYGTHVMYFSSQGTPVWLILSRDNKTTEVRQEFITGLQEKYTITRLAHQLT